MNELLQHLAVTLGAVAAAAFLARRLFASASSDRSRPGCAGCPSARASRQVPAQTIVPLQVVRKSR